MTGPDELVALEHAGWAALSSSGRDARAFYDDVLASEVVMLLPGGLAITDRAQALDSMSGAPWDRYELRHERVHAFTERCAAVTYRAEARRDQQRYDALASSTYVRDGDRWLLALHQQTPS